MHFLLSENISAATNHHNTCGGPVVSHVNYSCMYLIIMEICISSVLQLNNNLIIIILYICKCHKPRTPSQIFGKYTRNNDWLKWTEEEKALLKTIEEGNEG